MVSLGVRQGVASPSVSWHAARSLVRSVHGNDFTTAGAKPDLNWLEVKLEASYEVRK